MIENSNVKEQENNEEFEKPVKVKKPRQEGKRPPGRPSTKNKKNNLQEAVPSFFTQ